jgi:UrcA family protein
MIKTWLKAATLGLALLPGTAFAEAEAETDWLRTVTPSRGAAASVIVRVSDLDLASQDGKRTARHRISIAVQNVCSRSVGVSSTLYSSCLHDSGYSAQASLRQRIARAESQARSAELAVAR